jgi:hypothetical protein
METKICKYCHKELLLSEFPHYKGSLDGHHWQCKQCKSNFNKERYQKKKKEILLKQKEYLQKKKEDPLFIEKRRLRALINNKTEEHKKSVLLYNSKEETKKKKAAYERKRKEDPSYKLIVILRRRYYNLITSNPLKKSSVLSLLGCSIEEFRKHIESQFQEGMTWENYGSYWHLDHIIPCSYFDQTDLEQQKICWNYQNLQPLKAKDNLKKGAKIPDNVETLILKRI